MDVKKICLGQGYGQGNLSFQDRGFTLIELLVPLAIISILIANALPSLSALIAQERTTLVTNTLTGALAYARSEAVTKQATIMTCQSNNGLTCNISDNWHNGWIVFIDKNRNKLREPEETLLRAYSATGGDTRVMFNASGRGTHYYMKYKPLGTAWPNGSFLICNPNIGIGKALIMTQSGRLRLSKKTTSGSAITC